GSRCPRTHARRMAPGPPGQVLGHRPEPLGVPGRPPVRKAPALLGLHSRGYPPVAANAPHRLPRRAHLHHVPPGDGVVLQNGATGNGADPGKRGGGRR
ncbi:MAG: Tryptophan 2,3-dioxygenase, partial [uncultured Cytophagales bacterium]